MSASAIVAGRASIEAKIDGIAKAVADLGRLQADPRGTRVVDGGSDVAVVSFGEVLHGARLGLGLHGDDRLGCN